jgi:hypothetical protein
MSDMTAPGGAATAEPPGTANGQGGAQQTADQAKEKAQEAAGQAKEKAQEAKQQVGGRVREQVDQRATQVGEQVASTASDLRSVGEQLRSDGKDQPAKLAEQAAERTERLGSYLRDSDADTILGDVEDFARRQPWAVVAGGLALGFAASRFLKASSSERYQQSRQRGQIDARAASPGAHDGADGRTAVSPPAPSVPPAPPVAPPPSPRPATATAPPPPAAPPLPPTGNPGMPR